MNAYEKVGWLEMIASASATLLFAALYPWLGPAAMGAFGLMGFVGFGVSFLKPRGGEIVSDERDATIVGDAVRQALSIAWVSTILSLTVIVTWHLMNEADISAQLMANVLWLQGALCYFAKGALTVRAYKGSHHASEV